LHASPNRKFRGKAAKRPLSKASLSTPDHAPANSNNKKPSEAAPGGFGHPLPDIMRKCLPRNDKTLWLTPIKVERAQRNTLQILQARDPRFCVAF